MKTETFPVVIPTLNRYNHFVNCVESLSRCYLALETELVVGVDYPPSEKYVEGFNQICNFIPSIKGFGKVTVFYHKHNLGPVGNLRFLKDYCFSKYDALIITEDDNVFAPCFLDFMNKALCLYSEDERILSVSGYSPIGVKNSSGYTAYLSKDNNGWGLGLWKSKEKKLCGLLCDDSYFKSVLRSPLKGLKILKTYPMLYLMLHIMVRDGENWGDAKRATVNIIENKFQVRPICSLVRNEGFDGSGVNCSSQPLAQSELVMNETFDMRLFDNGNDCYDSDALYEQMLPTDDKAERDKLLKRVRKSYFDNINPLKYYHIGRKFRSLFKITK